MLRLSLESVPYTELDFPEFNPEGFRRIQQAVEVAQQQKALAQRPDELQQAVSSLRAVSERRALEQQIAQRNFDARRRQTFEALQTLQSGFRSAKLQGPRRLEAETRIDHLVTLFNLKDFDAVIDQVSAVRNTLHRQPVRSTPASSSCRNVADQPQSATALFLRAQELERMGDIRKAVEVYGQVLEHNPRHFQAINHLNRISGRGRKAAW